MRIRHRRPYPLFQFTLSYLLILLIPLAMGLVHFLYVLDLATTQTVYTNTLILKNSMDALENSLKSISTYSRTLNQLKVLDDIVSARGRENVDLVDLRNAVTQYPALRDDSRYVDIQFLYSSRNGIILAPLQAFLNVEMYYGTYFDFGDMPFDQWSREILHNAEKPDGILLLGSEESGRRLVYQTPYLSRSDGRVAGQQIFLLDERRIHNALAPAFQMGAGFMYIEDRRGTRLVTMEQEGWTAGSVGPLDGPLAEGSMERVIDGKKMMVTYCKSPDFGLTYVIAVPKSTLVATAMDSLRMALAIMAAIAGVGVALILFSYRYNMSPLLSMASHLAPAGEPGTAPLRRRIHNGLWQLSASITSLVSDNSRMEEQLALQQEALRQSFLVQLVTGQILEEDRLPELLRSCGVGGVSSRIRGVYLKLLSREAGDLPDAREAVEESVVSSHPLVELVPCFWIDNRHLTLLCLEGEEAEPGACMELLRDLHFRIMDRWGLETTLAVGAEYAQYSEVHQSFSEARRLLAGDGGGSPILRTSEPDPARRENYSYGSREEEALQELAGAGRFGEVLGLLGKIRRANFQERRLSLEMRELLFYRMASTLLCAGWGAELPLSRTALSTLDTEEFFRLLTEQYELVCGRNARRLQESQERMKSEIVAYIDANFRDRDMGLNALSQRFGVTESYLSTLIKGLVGENFSSYLESKRIDEANRLLRAGGRSVADIGSRVGYDSATSFGRAYKRVMGHSPSQYLKLHSNKSML